MHSLSREEVRGIDRYAIDVIGIPGATLMENAGRNVTDAVEELLGDLSGRTVAVVAGAGNNGGDGFVVARHLAIRGAGVVTFLVVPAEKVVGDAAINLSIIRNLGHDIREITPQALDGLGEALDKFDAVVDALGGTGIQGRLRGDIAEAVEQINLAGKPVVAVDIPTGLDCDTGKIDGPVVRAAVTVTFIARKQGFDAPGAEACTGRVRVADIGIPPEQLARLAAGERAE